MFDNFELLNRYLLRDKKDHYAHGYSTMQQFEKRSDRERSICTCPWPSRPIQALERDDNCTNMVEITSSRREQLSYFLREQLCLNKTLLLRPRHLSINDLLRNKNIIFPTTGISVRDITGWYRARPQWKHGPRSFLDHHWLLRSQSSRTMPRNTGTTSQTRLRSLWISWKASLHQ